MYINSRRVAAFVVLILTLVSSIQTLAEQLPVEQFAKLPVVSNPVISPDGKRLAMTIVSKGKPILIVQPLDKSLKDQSIGKISVGDLHIHEYLWANNERLIIAVRDSDTFRGYLWNIVRVMAIDWNGKNPVGFKMQPNDWGFLRQRPGILHSLPADDKHVLALLDDRKDGWNRPDIHKVDVYTGKKSIYQRSSMGVQQWLTDQQGNVLVGQKFGTRGSTDATTYYRANQEGEWQVMQDTDYFSSDRLTPYRIHEHKSHILLLSTRADEKNYWRKPDETELELYEYDLNLGEIVGEYKNQELLSAKAKVEEQLKDLTIRHISSDQNGERLVFSAFSDIRPLTYYLYLKKQNRLMQLGREYPQLDGKVAASMEAYEYEARDGLMIPAFFTKPQTESLEELPLIVYPHGGPWVNDEWGFDSRVQFLASRGYAVFQPQFRGSTGYGLDHEEAGYGEWGAAIQDDITDGVRDLIDRGIVDKNRICIIGSSFGGYAAAMGLVKTPELYRCGVSINGVLSLPKYQADSKNLLFAEISRTFNSSENPAALSPHHNTEAIKAPLLLIAGKKDSVVPYQHSKRMYERLKKEGKDISYLEFKDGEHWRTNEANEIKMWQTINTFLTKHLPVN